MKIFNAFAFCLFCLLYINSSFCEDEQVPVTCGSIIRLQNLETLNHLHSHNINYGSGSRQQSVTGLRNTDDTGSLWLVKGKHGTECPQGRILANGDIIRLEHLTTRKNLHSHQYKSPLSNNQEVSAFGQNSRGDSGDNFELVLENGKWYRDEEIILKHESTNSYLADSSIQYGKPVQGQTEICTLKNKDPQSIKWKATYGIYFPAERNEI
ncbi:stromal cell-derived factor 2-like protein [Anaeramoeba flamelloides]|uniref:Stromal cell-derived factor 2-like protein n=1 Tax=Anaeramoeba flamelloides TaxID=1746091 RepID=A0ABQ8XKK4_9EUKA|nr:stromal cell-derived factor 2-like protein [Anaeramoeba flamelloides]